MKKCNWCTLLTLSLVLTLQAYSNLGSAQTHMQLIRALVGDNDITHTAINSGSWFDSQTWQNGEIPTADAWVLIPENLTVTYDQVSTVAIRAIKSLGHLKFSPSQSSLLRIDTLVIDSNGSLVIGTKDNPIQTGVEVNITFVDNGNLDVVRDPLLFGRGILAMGEVKMHGENKTTHLKVTTDPLIGNTQLTLAQAPKNWHIGDTLVLAGTKYSGWKWDNDIHAVRYFGTEDEVLTITNIQHNTISFDTPLVYDHFTPRADLKTSVGNYSRNISISTEGLDEVERHHRGHVMFVHHANVDVRYAAFWQLGRTSKDDPSFNAEDISPMLPDSNVRARYPFHFHRSGIEDVANPAIGIGNAVFGSPGWGYVHHDSNAILHNNVSFDTFGAGFVAETGNEIGVWTNNLAIKGEGNRSFNPKNGNPREEFDIGRTGDGFWFQGRMVRANNNIAASVNHGYVYLHRGSGMLSFEGTSFMLPEALSRTRLTGPDDTPILNFDNNEAFASTVGLYVVKANPNQQHGIHSHLSNFTGWEVRAGAAIEYTSHYLLSNFDIIGSTPSSFLSPLFGIDFGTNTSDMTIIDAKIANMEIGIGLGKLFTDEEIPIEKHQYVVINPTFQDVEHEYESFDANVDLLLNTSDLVPNRFDVNLANSNPFEYLSPATSAGSGVSYTGVLTDSIGNIPIPAGTDGWGTPSYDMIGICEQDGYYRTSDGTPYAIVEEFFSDRSTGKIHKHGLKTLLGPEVESVLGNQFFSWLNAFQAGIIDINSLAPVTTDDVIAISQDSQVIINLLTNDSDPESDPLSIDGIVQPQHGRVFLNVDNTVKYIPDFDYFGTDSFSYWATDGNGNYTPAEVIINIEEGLIFENGFE